MNERRRNPRVNPPEELIARIKATVPARILDISCDGMQVEVASPLRPSVACDVALPGPDGEVKLRAMVARCRATTTRHSADDERRLWYRAGLSFTGLSSETRMILEDMIIDFTLSERPGSAQSSFGPGHPIKIRVDQESLAQKKNEQKTASRGGRNPRSARAKKTRGEDTSRGI